MKKLLLLISIFGLLAVSCSKDDEKTTAHLRIRVQDKGSLVYYTDADVALASSEDNLMNANLVAEKKNSSTGYYDFGEMEPGTYWVGAQWVNSDSSIVLTAISHFTLTANKDLDYIMQVE